jgi:hypothetical protein
LADLKKKSYLMGHLHAGIDEPLNVTFIRAPSSAFLKIDVPLVFIGDDASPGLSKGPQFIYTFINHL